MSGEDEQMPNTPGQAVGEASQGNNKQGRGIRPRRSRKPIDPDTGKPVKRTEFSIALGHRLKGARLGPAALNDPKEPPLYEPIEVVNNMNELTDMPWNDRTLASYENGYAVPPVEKLLALANFYHAGLDYLVRGQEAENVQVEQVLDKLPEELRLPMFVILKNPDLGKAIFAISKMGDNGKHMVFDILGALANLNEANLQALQTLAHQLAGSVKS